MEAHDQFQPRVLSDEEIEMYLDSDPKAVDRLILYSLNRLAALHLPCSRRVEDMLKVIEHDLGGVKSMKLRAEWVNLQLKKAQDEAAFWEDMRKRIKTAGVWASFICLLGILAFYWNHHVPEAMAIDISSIPKVIK